MIHPEGYNLKSPKLPFHNPMLGTWQNNTLSYSANDPERVTPLPPLGANHKGKNTPGL